MLTATHLSGGININIPARFMANIGVEFQSVILREASKGQIGIVLNVLLKGEHYTLTDPQAVIDAT